MPRQRRQLVGGYFFHGGGEPVAEHFELLAVGLRGLLHCFSPRDLSVNRHSCYYQDMRTATARIAYLLVFAVIATASFIPLKRLATALWALFLS